MSSSSTVASAAGATARSVETTTTTIRKRNEEENPQSPPSCNDDSSLYVVHLSRQQPQHQQQQDPSNLTTTMQRIGEDEEVQYQQQQQPDPQDQQQQFQHPEGRLQLAEDAPAVDLTLFIVENKGLEISNHPIHGRIMVATRDFNNEDLNESILRELPALICDSQDYLDFMEQFLDLPPQVQVGIFDLYYQPLDSPIGKALLEPAELLYVLGVLEDFTVIHQLLSIYMTNAHQYQQTKSAVSLFGSKFSHSCNPNVGYSSTSGLMEYHVLKPIQKGEQVTFSYLADLYETPTNERRQLLQTTKSFTCYCERCIGPDYSRCIKCPTCKNCIVPCQYTSKNNDNSNTKNYEEEFEPYWDCPKCGMLETSHMLKIERVFENLLKTIEEDLHERVHREQEQNKNTGGFDQSNNKSNNKIQFTPTMLQGIVNNCQIKMSLTHHLTVKALRLYINVATKHVFTKSTKLITRHYQELRSNTLNSRHSLVPAPSNDKSKIYAMIRSTILAGFQLVLACECVAANCKGCYDKSVIIVGDDNDNSNSNSNNKTATSTDGKQSSQSSQSLQKKEYTLQIVHDPHYDRTTPMRHFCEDLLGLPFYWWPPLALTMMERYLPLLKSKFHNRIQNIQRCIDYLHTHEILYCLQCHSVPDWENPNWAEIVE